jgi:hypothetical protein
MKPTRVLTPVDRHGRFYLLLVFPTGNKTHRKRFPTKMDALAWAKERGWL